MSFGRLLQEPNDIERTYHQQGATRYNLKDKDLEAGHRGRPLLYLPCISPVLKVQDKIFTSH